MTAPHDVARRFARALDAEDYAAAAACLSADCEYDTGTETLRGPDAIIGSYRANADWAARTLNSVRYESEIRPGAHDEIVITFIDHIEHAGRALTHRCEQHVTFNDSGLIRRIRHHELSGESARLQQFLALVNVRKPS